MVQKIINGISDASYRHAATKMPEIKATNSRRILMAGLSGIASAGLTSGALLGIAKIMKKAPPSLLFPAITTGVAGAVTGFMVPDMLKAIREGKDVSNTVNRIRTGIITKSLEKEASFFGANTLTGSIIKPLWGAGKFGTKAGVGFVKTVFSPKVVNEAGKSVINAKSIGRTAARTIAGAGVLGGAIAGGSLLHKKFSTGNAYEAQTLRSGPNYTTMLRNNVLAGKIAPSELNPDDLARVRKLGLS